MPAPRPSRIKWTDLSGADANFVWRGYMPEDCKVSPGCANCYVERIIRRMSNRWPPFTTFFPDKFKRLIGNSNLRCVTSIRGYGKRPMVFVCDTGDMFHANVSDRWIKIILNGFRVRRDIVWQILTKRARRMTALVNEFCDEVGLDQLPDNIWIGVSTENAHTFAERTAALREARATIRWVSAEPLLAPITLGEATTWLSWVVVGGETGVNARPMHPDWARSIRDECAHAHVPFFLKHLGQYTMWKGHLVRVNRDIAGRRLDDRYYNYFPNVN